MAEECSLDFKPFCEYHQKDLTKTLVIIASFVVNLMSGIFMYSIIWYERFGSDRKRILTNKFVSMICWSAICILLRHFHFSFCSHVKVFMLVYFFCSIYNSLKHFNPLELYCRFQIHIYLLDEESRFCS